MVWTALALLLAAVGPALPRTLAADRRFARYLRARRRYQRNLATQAQRLLDLETQ